MNFHIIRCTQTKRFALNFQSDDRRGEKMKFCMIMTSKFFTIFFEDLFFFFLRERKKKKFVKATSGKL